jgi:hypothetical protein
MEERESRPSGERWSCAQRRAGGRRECCHALGFGRDRATTERGHPVVSPALIVGIGGGTALRLDDEAIVQHSAEKSVQRACLQYDAPARSLARLAHDGVAVPLSVEQHEQDVECVLPDAKDFTR